MSKVTWTADPAHSEVTFKVRHMMIANVTGVMNDFKLEVKTEKDDFSDAEVFFSGRADSIDTGNKDRDNHLRTQEFFDAQQNPEIIFRSTNYEKEGDGYKLHGDLTIRGETKPVTLDVEFGGIQKDPWGKTRAGFTVTGKLNRKDFGLTWNTPLEKGGVLVGDTVKISCEIELVKQEEQSKDKAEKSQKEEKELAEE
jgi:polyisoprenoid-binding protein YceI